MTLKVGQQVAELASLLALAEPDASVGEMMHCEARIRGLLHSQGLKLEFWAETPGGAFDELAIVETKALAPGEEARYVAEVEAEEKGRYTIYGYLYDGAARIGREVERIRVDEG